MVCNKINSPSTSCDTLNSDINVFKATGHICKVWFIKSFKKAASSLFSAVEKWSLAEEPANLENKNGDDVKGGKFSESQTANYSLLFLPCFVLISVGDALTQFHTSTAANIR